MKTIEITSNGFSFKLNGVNQDSLSWEQIDKLQTKVPMMTVVSVWLTHGKLPAKHHYQ